MDILWNIFIWAFPVCGVLIFEGISSGQNNSNKGVALLCALISGICVYYVWDFVLPRVTFWWISAAVLETLFGIVNFIGALGTKD